jgi:hypothetical protein
VKVNLIVFQCAAAFIFGFGPACSLNAQTPSNSKADAQSNTSVRQISGEVVAQAGSRISIHMADGRVQTVTITLPLPAPVIGRRISANVVEAGDTLLVTDATFGN